MRGDPGAGSATAGRSALVVAAQDAVHAAARELEALALDVRGVGSLVEAQALAREAKPDVVIVDSSVQEVEEAELAAAFAAVPTALRVLVLPETTGPWVSLASRCDVDAVVPTPLTRVAMGRLMRETDYKRGGTSVRVELPRLVDRSERMRDVWRVVALASSSEASVVVSGETGVGKEAVARALHRFSGRRDGPFVAVNCAALPEPLLESELFGHERGAFTGASGQRKGRFELADGGTLFLDEVGDLPLSLQVKLLRVLQEQRFERLGGMQTISVDVRVVSATHRDLADDVRRGRFRADLFYRIRALQIPVPPLSRRKEDILPLWEHFLADGARREGRSSPSTSMTAQRRLLRYAWPGNVRELQNAAEHALMTATSGSILPADLPELERESSTAGASSLVGMTLKELERLAILETYTALGTVKSTADALGVSERKVHYRLKQYREEGSTTARLSMAAASRRTDGPDDVAIEPPAPRILLAEDDDELRWGLHDFLKCAGYVVVPVRDGRALLEYLGAEVLLDQERRPPDAIVTDIRMPFLNGLQLLQKVKECGWSTPVVVISAFGDDEMRNRARSLGAAAFLDKPIDTDALLRVLKSVVAL